MISDLATCLSEDKRFHRGLLWAFTTPTCIAVHIFPLEIMAENGILLFWAHHPSTSALLYIGVELTIFFAVSCHRFHHPHSQSHRDKSHSFNNFSLAKQPHLTFKMKATLILSALLGLASAQVPSNFRNVSSSSVPPPPPSSSRPVPISSSSLPPPPPPVTNTTTLTSTSKFSPPSWITSARLFRRALP